MKRIKIGALLLLLGGVFTFNISILTGREEFSGINVEDLFTQANAMGIEIGETRSKCYVDYYWPEGYQGSEILCGYSSTNSGGICYRQELAKARQGSRTKVCDNKVKD